MGELEVVNSGAAYDRGRLMSEAPRSLMIEKAAGVTTPARLGPRAVGMPCARDIESC
jgi:hypothetical protein